MKNDLNLELLKLLLQNDSNNTDNKSIELLSIDEEIIGKKCIIRTYSAGVWFGEVYKKEKNEILLKSARRLWKWWAKKSISLSSIALYGVNYDNSKICEENYIIWLQPIEIIPCTQEAIQNLEKAPIVESE